MHIFRIIVLIPLAVILATPLGGCITANGFTYVSVRHESSRIDTKSVPGRPDCLRTVRRDKENSWASLNDVTLSPTSLTIEEVAKKRTAGNRTRTRIMCRPKYGRGTTIRGKIGG